MDKFQTVAFSPNAENTSKQIFPTATAKKLENIELLNRIHLLKPQIIGIKSINAKTGDLTCIDFSLQNAVIFYRAVKFDF